MNYTLPTPNTHYSFCDLVFEASHVLIGGTTGSGKSVFIDEYIFSLLGRFTPEQLKLVLIDPKRVSLYKYKNLPHTISYETENGRIISELDAMINEMERRYTLMQRAGAVEYSGSFIVIVIDELADLMVTCKNDIMPRLQRIAQLGRAARIKLLAATQAPNRKVIPAELVVNFTGRVALRCLSPIESKQIINKAGAEKLPQYGKSIYLHANGKYYEGDVVKVPDVEIQKRVYFWESQKPVVKPAYQPNTSNEVYFDNSIHASAKPSLFGFWHKMSLREKIEYISFAIAMIFFVCMLVRL